VAALTFAPIPAMPDCPDVNRQIAQALKICAAIWRRCSAGYFSALHGR